MPWPDLLTFVLATVLFGGLGGLIAGLFGIGGGIITVPLLYTIFTAHGIEPDIAMHVAVGTSLLTIVPTSIASLRAHMRHGALDEAILREWAGPVIVGAVLGGLIANHLSGPALSLLFGCFVLFVAAMMGFAPAQVETRKAPPKKGAAQKSIAFMIGLISALVGIGGGSLSVPTLIMCRTPVHRAIGTASAVGLLISVPASIVFMLSQAAHATMEAGADAVSGALPPGSFGNIDLLAFALLAPVSMVMAPVGAKLAHRLPATGLRRIFAVFLAFVAVKMIASGIR